MLKVIYFFNFLTVNAHLAADNLCGALISTQSRIIVKLIYWELQTWIMEASIFWALEGANKDFTSFSIHLQGANQQKLNSLLIRYFSKTLWHEALLLYNQKGIEFLVSGYSDLRVLERIVEGCKIILQNFL